MINFMRFSENIYGKNLQSNSYRKVTKLKTEWDLELIIEAHSNGFLKADIRMLENEEVIKNHTAWLSYNNWEENTRVFSEIIEIEINLSFILYYESFTYGGGIA
jgi:hypothetical protein